MLCFFIEIVMYSVNLNLKPNSTNTSLRIVRIRSRYFAIDYSLFKESTGL
jgi:hypothetical protein